MTRIIQISILCCIMLSLVADVGRAQVEPVPIPGQDEITGPIKYNLDGDDILIDYYETGISKFTADGNVALTYSFDETTWSLSAGHVELTAITENNENAMPLSAVADGNVFMTDGAMSFTTDGRIDIDFSKRLIESDSESVNIEFRDGTVTTENISIQEVSEGTHDNLTTRDFIQTFGQTNATIRLADSGILGDTALSNPSGSMFGSLTLNFSEVEIVTTDSAMEMVNGDPFMISFPNQTSVMSSDNTLTMPSCEITFDPPTLKGNEGVELSVGEDTSVVADFLNLEYPQTGNNFMYVEFIGLCSPPYPYIVAVPEQRVKIVNPDGTFTADIITITINRDGTRRIVATGCASFEMYLQNLEEMVDPGETPSD